MPVAEVELVMETVIGQEGPVARLMTTKSVAVFTPSVQFKVRVVGVVSVGYHGCVGSIGPPAPEMEMPEGPVGDVNALTPHLDRNCSYFKP